MEEPITPIQPTTTAPKKSSNSWLDTLRFILIALVIIIPLRFFVVTPFLVSGHSMDPSFQDGEYLLIDRLSYFLHEPNRGDVVIFRYPKNPSVYYIKRIIGLPGETVHIDHGNVTITTKAGESITLNEPYVVNDDTTYTKDSTLGTDEYFVMGDNRPRSSDSRFWGTLPRANIVGRALVRLLPPSGIGIFPGSFTQAP